MLLQGDIGQSSAGLTVRQRKAIIQPHTAHITQECREAILQIPEPLRQPLPVCCGGLYQSFLFDDFPLTAEAYHIGESAAPGTVKNANIGQCFPHKQCPQGKLLTHGDGMRRKRQIELVDGEDSSCRASRSLHLVNPQPDIVLFAECGESPKPFRLGNTLTTGSLDWLDDNPNDLLTHLAKNTFNQLQTQAGTGVILGLRGVVIYRRKGDFDISRRCQPMEVLSCNRVQRFGDLQSVYRASMKRLIEVQKTASAGTGLLPASVTSRIVSRDQILQHILNRFCPGVNDIDFAATQLRHRLWEEAIEEPIIRERFRGYKVRIRDFIIRGQSQMRDVLRLLQARVIVTDELRAIVSRPVKDALTVNGCEIHSFAARDIQHKRPGMIYDIALHFSDHLPAQRSRIFWRIHRLIIASLLLLFKPVDR